MRQREIFWFWLPLAASWILMTAEGPIISAAINRLPEEVVMLAAQGIVVSLSVMIQSPIINLLATSTALVQNRQSFLMVRRFTIHWIILLTLITIAVAWTPLFTVVVEHWLGVPSAVAAWVRPGMRIMTGWSAVIAWRRFLQGVLIQFGYTNTLAYGTVIRFGAVAVVMTSLALFSNWPGAIIGATALIFGVTAEAVYATLAVRPLLQNELHVTATEPHDDPLSYGDLMRFHLPLAGTAVLVLLIQPIVTSSLARLDNPTESLAAWPILFQITLIFRAVGLALPEAVIALMKKVENFVPIRTFSIRLTAVITLLMALFIFTPAGRFYIFNLQDTTATVGEFVQNGLVLLLLFPGLNVINAWLRGMLIHARTTKIVNIGMGINLAVTTLILAAGLLWRWPGIQTAVIALNGAITIECIYLAWQAQQTLSPQLPLFAGSRPASTLVGD